jgi:methylated-DNA-[protein]-cysteine S-methyltransferase
MGMATPAASAARRPPFTAATRATQQADNGWMRAAGSCLFDTAFGRCGIAWSAHGVCALQLPEGNDTATSARLRRRAHGAEPGEPPPRVQRAIAGIAALLRGEAVNLDFVELDLQGVPALHRRVYAVARAIPRGATLSYGEVAERLGDRTLARAVGQALARNPFAPVVPCHRVLAAHGQAGGFSAPGGLRTKLRLLTLEGAHPSGAPDLFSSG